MKTKKRERRREIAIATMSDKQIKQIWREAFDISWNDPRDTVVIFARLLEKHYVKHICKQMVENREYKSFTGESVVRDPDRIDHVIEKVREIWKKYPDLRLGQLLDNAVVMHTLPIGQNHIFLVEDEELVKALDGLEERLKERDHEG